MTATVNLETAEKNTMMIVKFPGYTLRFAVALAGNKINKIISYKDGVIGIAVGPDNEEDYIELDYICSWIGYKKPNIKNILLEGE